MAALPNTGITTSMVAQAIGVGSNDVGTLCSHSNVNKWSRFRPGYWYCSSNLADIQFVRPDGTTRDYRSTESSVRGYMRYHLGDFRSYNHSANAMILVTAGNGIIRFNPTSQSVNISYTFWTGDVDWRCEEVQENAVNRLNPSGGTCTKFILKDTDNNVLGSVNIPTSNTLLTIGFTVAVAGYAKTVGVDLFLGDEIHTSGFAKFPSMGRTYSLQPQQNPQFGLSISPSFVSFIQSDFESQTGIIATAVQVYPSSVTMSPGQTSINISNLKITVGGANGKTYDVIAINNSYYYGDLRYRDVDNNFTYEYNKSYMYKEGSGGVGSLSTITFSKAINYDEGVTLVLNSNNNDLIYLQE